MFPVRLRAIHVFNRETERDKEREIERKRERIYKVITHLPQNVFPVRLRAVHVINGPFFFKSVFGLFKPFLQLKLLQRVGVNVQSYASKMRHFLKKPSLDAHAWLYSLIAYSLNSMFERADEKVSAVHFVRSLQLPDVYGDIWKQEFCCAKSWGFKGIQCKLLLMLF